LSRSLFENWNRYYDPFTGRYLQPEPLLMTPSSAARYARGGRTLPAYAYALNNPVSVVDPDGQDALDGSGSKSGKLQCTSCPGLDPKDSPRTPPAGTGNFCFADQGDDKSNCSYSKNVRNNYCGANGEKSLACKCANDLSRSICKEDYCTQ
jgi:RHS repeat-associated protein